MNKSKFLTLATTAAVIATTAGTFAIWDTLNAESTGVLNVNVRSATVTAELTDLNFGVGKIDVDNDTMVYESKVNFKVENNDLLKNLTITPSIKKNDNTEIGTDTINVEVLADTGESANDETTFTGGVDTTVEPENKYIVRVTAKKAANNINYNVNVSAKGTLNN